ncbi:MAG: hypothetical protein Q8P68_00515 [Candidatus Peregrinibacteria bacterium]|nr:hypothetical protein [Candidatus Peregrinibacteria bacterium]MDZ4245184.1 hypothetical protein [Candidatus Gracilibacteria bacterium]
MLNAKALGMSGGLLWGSCMLVSTFIGMYFVGYASGYFDMLMGMYPGYELSVPGAFIGFAYGFADGFIGMFLLGWLYNRCDAKCPFVGSKKKK